MYHIIDENEYELAKALVTRDGNVRDIDADTVMLDVFFSTLSYKQIIVPRVVSGSIPENLNLYNCLMNYFARSADEVNMTFVGITYHVPEAVKEVMAFLKNINNVSRWHTNFTLRFELYFESPHSFNKMKLVQPEIYNLPRITW